MDAGTRDPIRDVVIVGGGHNALVAAAYLARAGRTVTLLERLDHVGGAAVSERPWDGVDARLSRYSYLVSLLPRRIIDELGLDIRLHRRRYSSYTPDPADPRRGILIDTSDREATAESFARVTDDAREAERFAALTDRLGPLATAVFPTMTGPLPRAGTIRRAVGDDGVWHDIVEAPLCSMLRASLSTDIARGIVLTDGLIGTFAASDESDLRQNRCFLYHVVGGGTGDWDVPIGGMGQVSAALERAARAAGAELRTGVEVTSISPDGEVVAADGERLAGRLVLSGVGGAVLDRLVAAGSGVGSPVDERLAPEGAQLKVNMLLRRLPRLRDDRVSPEAAFAGTFHINETMSQLDAAYDTASGGGIPDPLPAEIYCHSLSDPSILGPALRASGAHTLTLFGLQLPHRLLAGQDPDAARATLLAAAQRSLDSVLAEPIEDCIFEAPDGSACIEARTTADLEDSLGMVGGNIFHGDLSWPWAGDDEPLDTPATRWGVATAHERVLVCGSSSRRGGAVSGLGGHSAAMAALELLAAM
ncbi:phytoene dehydrogenase-like protein [Microbacterium terrae]|uniref:Thiazole biosynthetic enzyme n=1 Tax=Microbacterium terrae TaxID=69369 RepID=A0A0M2GVG4_9MICO|nr:NAD(P)/FAD-dependent oxidoreductase [Microbacterium terrae]KJL37487.1 putative thiazole biosynthetic enzyme [Microbacterium terrae]MBP1076316.1 phytoene dehydrogenase-like protein [Microbacterium terrae]GLJ97138.1 phytoene dehydrogenase [Microbacterium terrae]